MRKLFQILILFFALLPSQWHEIQAQGADTLFSGTWMGEVTQDPGGHSTNYPFKVDIVNIGNHRVKGISYSYVYDDNPFAVMEFEGTIFKGELLVFQETKILEHTELDGYIWCIKGGQLKFEKSELGQHFLKGFWQGTTAENGPCIPGKIFLEKKLIP